MIRLGFRLSLASGPWGLIPTALAAVAVGFGTAILLFALSFQPALHVRYDHTAWRQTPAQVNLDDTALPADALLLSLTHDFVGDEPLTRMDVAAAGPAAPVPPGIPQLPAPGDAYVSPALAGLLADSPAGLAARFGRVVGVIGDAGLAAPNELAVVQGAQVADLKASGARAVTVLDSVGELPSFDFIVDIIVAVAVVGALAPVAVFVATATRVAAARRERRLVALRLSGATPGQVAVLAAVDALLIAAPGAVLGVLLFLLLCPLVALVPLVQLTWFPEAIAPPLLQAVALVIAVPVVGVAAAIASLRRLSISPLGVARRVQPGPLGKRRVVPLLVALVAYVVSLGAGATIFRDAAVAAVSISFFGIILGIVIAGPWLTAIVGRVVAARGGVIRLLAGRRLVDDPRGSFGAVAGVVMAVFVASTFFGFVAFVHGAAGAARVPVRPTSIYAAVPGGDGDAADAVAGALRVMAGVREVVVVRDATLQATRAAGGDSGGTLHAWIAPCDAFLRAAAFDTATCGTGDVHPLTSDVTFEPGMTATGYPLDATLADLDGTATVTAAVSDGTVSTSLLSRDEARGQTGLPDVIVEPSLVEQGGVTIRPSFLLVATTGEATIIERVRTAIERAMPTSGPATGSNLAATATRIFDELERVVSLGVFLALLVAGCSLAVAVAGGLLDRRRPFALLRLSGVPVAHLRAVLVVEAGAPLVTVAMVSALLGLFVSQLVTRLVAAGAPVPLPSPTLAILLVGSVAGAMAIVAGVLPLVRPITDLEETRFE